jgi:hypothetical protein
VDYLSTQYVIDRLNELFGHSRWTASIVELKVYDEADRPVRNHPQKVNCVVSAQAHVRLTVTFPDGTVVSREDVGLCDSSNPTRYGARTLAVKGAVSDATKRCSRTFGPQFGLGLYGELGQELGAPGTQEHRWATLQFKRVVGSDLFCKIQNVVGSNYEKVKASSLVEWAEGFSSKHTDVFPATLQDALTQAQEYAQEPSGSADEAGAQESAA